MFHDYNNCVYNVYYCTSSRELVTAGAVLRSNISHGCKILRTDYIAGVGIANTHSHLSFSKNKTATTQPTSIGNVFDFLGARSTEILKPLTCIYIAQDCCAEINNWKLTLSSGTNNGSFVTLWLVLSWFHLWCRSQGQYYHRWRQLKPSRASGYTTVGTVLCIVSLFSGV